MEDTEGKAEGIWTGEHLYGRAGRKTKSLPAHQRAGDTDVTGRSLTWVRWKRLGLEPPPSSVTVWGSLDEEGPQLASWGGFHKQAAGGCQLNAGLVPL